MEIIKLPNWTKAGAPTIGMRCPACRRMGTFETGPTEDVVEASNSTMRLGSRRCPNPECRAHVFTVIDGSNHLVASYPAETIDFDSTNLPENVLESLQEAIRCQAAQCFRSAALMVRRTLEELCEDKQATGNTLKDRLHSLSGLIAVATKLVEGLDTLRLLGNDAAHVELKDFDTVGKTESELAIEIVKELLKGIYQYDDLVGRLDALRQQRP